MLEAPRIARDAERAALRDRPLSELRRGRLADDHRASGTQPPDRLTILGCGAELACAASGGQPHPVIGLWPVRLRDELREALAGEGIRKVDRWTARYRLATVSFADRPVDPFFNANRPEDLEQARALLEQLTG